jgi:molecular chaperone HtpG
MGSVKHPFQAEVSQVLRLVIHSLYANKEIFLRELLSNASDALDRRRFAAIQRPELLDEGESLRIRLVPDAAAGTLTIWDNGIGMSEDELAQNLGTIAWSGSRDFLEGLKRAENPEGGLPQLIGQFGVGFYSGYLVADRVRVVSRKAGSEQAFAWESSGEQDFTIEPAERDAAGTSVTLHLKPDQREYLEPFRLRRLIERYSDYLAHSIELPKADDPTAFESVNRAAALWRRSPKEVEPAQYVEFYKHLTHDWEEPLAHRHFRIEGKQEFTGLLFLPSRPPFDLFDSERRHGVRLHVRRVLVMDDCAELVPRYLRFIRGLVDSEDLPLNVSREVLQDSRLVQTIQKQIVNQALEMIAELMRDRPEAYEKFWSAFGAVLKEGLYFDPSLRERLAKLLRYESLTAAKAISLDEYAASMKEGQPAIYYVTGPTRAAAAASPHLERIREQGFDVLLMTDPVDTFVMEQFTEYEGKRLLSVTAADLPVDSKGEEEKRPEAEAAEESNLLSRFGDLLKGTVTSVRRSTRLKDSPACLITPEGGLPPHMERLLRAQNREVPLTRRILELNLEHPLVKSIERLDKVDPSRAKGFVELLYQQALLAEGSPIEDPAEFAKKLTELMTSAAEHELRPAT